MATIVDTHTLLRLVGYGLASGVGATLAVALIIFGATRAHEMRRTARSAAATAYGTLAGVALVASTALVVYGLVLVISKPK